MVNGTGIDFPTDSLGEGGHGDDRRTRSWPPWASAAVAVCVIAVMIGAFFGWRWWSHPNVLPDLGAEVGGTSYPVGTPWNFGGTFPAQGPGQTITFTGPPAPRFAKNDADVTVRFGVCHLKAGQGPIGATGGNLKKWCSHVTPVTDGVTFTYPSPHEYLIVTMIPRQPGATHMTHVDFHYRTGRSDWYRRGTQEVTMNLSVRTGTH